MLTAERPVSLGVVGIPNARVLEAVSLNKYAERGGFATVSALHGAVAREKGNGAMDPEDFWLLAEGTSYDLDIGWSGHEADGSFHLQFRDREAMAETESFPPPEIEKTKRNRRQALANIPARPEWERARIDALRAYLRGHLPEPMLPEEFLVLDALPRTPNGKLDRAALPAPTRRSGKSQKSVSPPNTPTEHAMAGLWSELLGQERVDVDADFFELGGQSLLAARLVAMARDRIGIRLPIQLLFDAPTVRALSARVDRLLASSEAESSPQAELDLEAEAFLDPERKPAGGSFSWPSRPSEIFLTGATGFLGSFLLHELLERTEARVSCLVRCESARHGLARLKKAFRDWRISFADVEDRVHVVRGDLGQPRLGMAPSEWDRLAASCSAIYHVGAWVNLSYPYTPLKPANVGAVYELLELASYSHTKPIHHCSSIGIFYSSAYAQTKTVYEEEPVLPPIGTSGYNQTKWVAEKLFLKAREKGFPVNIYRFGGVVGHSRSGASNPRDYLAMAIKGLIRVGLVPPQVGSLEILSVDHLCRALVHLSLSSTAAGKVFHLVGPRPFPFATLTELIRGAGYRIEPVSYKQWSGELAPRLRDAPEIEPALRYLLGRGGESFRGQRTLPPLQYDRHNTFTALSGSGFELAPVSPRVLLRAIAFLRERGFLPDPS